MHLSALCAKNFCLPQPPFAKKINAVVYSNYFPLLAFAVTLLAHFLHLELAAYTLCAALVVYISFFGKDYSPLFSLVVFCYLMPGRYNNPGKHESSIFYMQNGAWLFILLAALLIIAFVIRLVRDPEIGLSRMLHTPRRLLPGMLLLSAAYLLAGIGSDGYAAYAKGNLVFAFLQIVSVLACYFIFSFSVKWEELDRRYFAIVGLLMGLLVGAELVGLYLTEPILQNGAVLRDEIYVGWGICNNMGLLIAMAIPFAFYFIFRGEHPLLYNFVALLFCGLALLSTSRGALVGAAAAYVLCLFIVLFLGKDAKAKCVCLITLVLLCGVGLAVLALFPDMLRSMFTRGASGTRERLYEYGMRVFARSPLFGEGFFSLNRNAAYFSIWEKVGDFSDSFPERWHNTLVQLFACCGMAGFLAYVYHRYQTLQLFLRRINTEKIFIGISLLVMLVLGLVDCHFFNIGPVLVYSLALAFVEYKEA